MAIKMSGVMIGCVTGLVVVSGLFLLLVSLCLQCFDAVGWVAGRASSL